MLLPNDHGGLAAKWLGSAGAFFVLLNLLPRLALATEPTTAITTAVSAAPATPGATFPATPTGTSAAAGANADQTLLLEVDVNGNPIGKIGEFTLRRGKLMARPDELRDLGFRVPESRAPGPGDLIPLSDLPGLTYVLDQKNQELHVTVSDSRLLPTVLLPVGREENENRRVIESGTGVTLNYDIVDTVASGQTGATGSLDLRGFSPWGVLSSGWLGYAGAASSGSGTNTAIRLDSSYTFADVNSLRRYSLGDFITGGLAWTRPVHLEGVQIRSDFSMRPDLVTFPLPSVTGSAAVPSTVDVLADGNRVVSNQVARSLPDSATPGGIRSGHDLDDGDQCAGPTGDRDATLLREFRAAGAGSADLRRASRHGAAQLGRLQQ